MSAKRAPAGGGPLEHWQVAVGIAEGHHGAAADVLVDADGLALFVIVEVQLRQAHEHGLPVAHFKFRLDAAADNLLGRYAVNFLRPRTHELDAAARDDKGNTTPTISILKCGSFAPAKKIALAKTPANRMPWPNTSTNGEIRMHRIQGEERFGFFMAVFWL